MVSKTFYLLVILHVLANFFYNGALLRLTAGPKRGSIRPITSQHETLQMLCLSSINKLLTSLEIGRVHGSAGMTLFCICQSVGYIRTSIFRGLDPNCGLPRMVMGALVIGQSICRANY
jgi:hypothetical protein